MVLLQLKLELLTILVLKSGKDKNTIVNVIYGL